MITIRQLGEHDTSQIVKIHVANKLPACCLPDAENPAFIVAQCAEIDGKLAMGAFVKVTGELSLILDHSVGTPKQRWSALKAILDSIEVAAQLKGLEDFAVFVPPDVEKAFGKRLKALGFVKSTWSAYGKVLPKDMML